MDPRKIRIEDYQYELPDERIARYPLPERSASKLLIWNNKSIVDDRYANLMSHLPSHAVLVFNNTRVVPVRLVFQNKNGARIEVFCLEPDLNQTPSEAMQQTQRVVWNCLIGRKSKWKEDRLILTFPQGQLIANLLESPADTFRIEFEWSPAECSFAEILKAIGEMPIPPYLKRASEPEDVVRYQTVFATNDGSVAAPTASLHFTPELLNQLKDHGIETKFLTLHVGAGTFKPVKSETLDGHTMHAEWMDISINLLESLLQAYLAQRPIFSVGTTSLRTLESIYWMGVKCFLNPTISESELQLKQWDAYELPQHLKIEEALQHLMEWLKRQEIDRLAIQTAILITPSYPCRTITGLLTNFHQPASTLLLLIASVVGEDWKTIYQHALNNDYRFLSYGDGSLLFNSRRCD